MTKTDLSYKLLVICDLLVTRHPQSTISIDDFKNYAANAWFCFRHNFFKIYPQDLKLV